MLWVACGEGNGMGFTITQAKSNSIYIITLATAQKLFSLLFPQIIYGLVLCIPHQVLLWTWFLHMLLYLYVHKIDRVFCQSVSMTIYLTAYLVPELSLAAGSVLKFAFMFNFFFFSFW